MNFLEILSAERCESSMKFVHHVDLEKPEKYEYLDTKIGVGTAENEHSQVCSI